MDRFQSIVITLAIVALIIMFIVVGVMLTQNSSNTTFPPYTNACPNYWATDNSGNCFIPQGTTAGTFGVNTGDRSFAKTGTNATYGLDSTKTYINFNDSGWANNGAKSVTCAKSTWANSHGILWDGISNFNGNCK